jgi:prephenate dehydrogenase
VTPRTGGPEAGPGRLGSAVVIGTGLIGTSIALAMCEQGVTVWLTDHDPAAARLAADLGAGKVLPEPLGAAERGQGAAEAEAPPGRRPQAEDGPWADLAVLAVPPAAVASSLAAAQARRLARWYTDVASVKALPLRQASELGCDLACFVPGHPLSRPPPGPTCSSAARG